MHIVRDKKTIKTYRLMIWYLIIGFLVVTAMAIWVYLMKGNKRIFILPPLLLVNNCLGMLYFRRLCGLDYSADPTGIKILAGKRVKKDLPWHSFSYVGELNIPDRTGPKKVIACLPEPPKPALSKDEDCYTFSQKGHVWIDYTPEDAQIMRPYYRGQLPPRI